MLIPDMFCNRVGIKMDAWHLFDLYNVKYVGGEDPVIKVRAAEILMSEGNEPVCCCRKTAFTSL